MAYSYEKMPYLLVRKTQNDPERPFFTYNWQKAPHLSPQDNFHVCCGLCGSGHFSLGGPSVNP